MVFLENGTDLHVTSDSSSQVSVTEIKSFSGASLMSFLNDLGANVAVMGAILSSGAKRLFRLSGHALAGKTGVAIRARDRKRKTLEAQLQAVVLKGKPMKVSLRQIQVFADDTRKTTTLLSRDAFDPKAALDHMNMVWTAQANVTWALGRTDPALIEAIDIRSEGPNRDNDTQNKALSANCDPSSDLTIFFSRKAFDPNGIRTSTPWNFAKSGYTYAKGGFCVVADHPVDFTVEHEEGHFLGALDERGNFVADFGHSSGHHMMNPDDVPNGVIPARMATAFNKGFAAKR